MGDVLIKGMKMPKGRRGVFVCVCPEGTAIIQDDEVIHTTAIELPPHGRLIDADALNYTMLYKENWMSGTGVEALAVWKKDIEDAPTIIPAEEANGCD